MSVEDESRADIKTVQARMRHASARTTLDTYGHLWPDADESTRTAVGAVIAARIAPTACPLRTEAPPAASPQVTGLARVTRRSTGRTTICAFPVFARADSAPNTQVRRVPAY